MVGKTVLISIFIQNIFHSIFFNKNDFLNIDKVIAFLIYLIIFYDLIIMYKIYYCLNHSNVLKLMIVI